MHTALFGSTFPLVLGALVAVAVLVGLVNHRTQRLALVAAWILLALALAYVSFALIPIHPEPGAPLF
jgi:lipopolysaccharide export LptBFGC system permease protein LptF